jgi:2-desacetyl-2-hydroxyethyl bacteriochlorophyllide A dehydrogenase
VRALAIFVMPDGRRERRLVTDWPPPAAKLGAHEFRTQTLYSGVTNGTERNHLTSGNYAPRDADLPSAWGYQNVGRVTEIGDKVTSVGVGDVLYLDGSHVEETVLDEDGLFTRLPTQVDRAEAALFGMGSVAVRACRTADVRLGDRVLVVGGGFVGQAVSQVASLMGGSVTLADVDADRLEIARSIGCVQTVVCVAPDTDLGDERYDVVVDTVGTPADVTDLIRCAVLHGRVVLVGGRFRVDYDFNLAQRREIQIRHTSHFDRSDLAVLRDNVVAGRFVIRPLLRAVLPVDQAKQTYDVLRDEPQRLLGTVFVW